MLCQFNPQEDGHDKVCYMIPFDWINNFMAYISASSSECLKPQKIENVCLIDKTNKVSPDDDDNNDDDDDSHEDVNEQ